MLPNGKLKLLIVDDCPEVVDLITNWLSDCTYDIRKAYDGDEAVSLAKEFHPECVLTGYMMPRMNGFKEAVAILQFHPTCKFVFMTGNAHIPEVRDEYQQLGFDFKFLLPKPFARLDLLNALALAGCPCSAAVRTKD